MPINSYTEEEVVLNNYGLVQNIAVKFNTTSSAYSLEDLMQVGFMSLIKAHRKFDPQKSQFSTFATICIKNDIIKYIQSNNRHLHYEEAIDYKGFTEENVSDLIPTLTEQEKEIVDMRLARYSFSEIADKLNISKTLLMNKRKIIFNKISKSNEEEKSFIC